LFSHIFVDHPFLPSFPTRRSSDLFDFSLDFQRIDEIFAHDLSGRNGDGGICQPEGAKAKTAKENHRSAGGGFAPPFPGQDSANHGRSPGAGSLAAARRMMSPSCKPESTTTSVSLCGPVFTARL